MSLDHLKVTAVEAYIRTHLSAWLWDHPVRSLMDRPVWLVPAAAGLLFAGGAMTAASYQKAPNVAPAAELSREAALRRRVAFSPPLKGNRVRRAARGEAVG